MYVCMIYACIMYVCIDAPRVLGVLYMYVCMIYACIMYVYVYVCTQFGALFGAPISIRRADRRVGIDVQS